MGWVHWGRMNRGVLALVLAMTALPAAGCRRLETGDLDAARARQARFLPHFRAPADGVLTDAQLDAFLRVRKAAGRRTEAEAASALGADPLEIAWVRARVVEALLVLEAARVTDAAFESYTAAIGRLREARRSEREASTAARLDVEIAGLERERASLRKGAAPATAAAKNAARVEARRTELLALGP